MDCPKISRAADYSHFLVYTLLFFAVFYILISTNNNPTQSKNTLSVFPRRSPPSRPLTTTTSNVEYTMRIYRNKLDEALAGACTEDKTVIIAVVNKAYVEGDKSMLDLFLDGFWVGEGTRKLIKHLLMVAVDQTSYERCMFLGLHCYKLETDGVDFVGEKLYMSADFIKMMWRRTQFLGDVLKLGYTFIFTDSDILWLRDPFPRLRANRTNETLDLQISTDNFNGDDRSESNTINTGFYMIRPNNRTVALFDSWYAMKNSSDGMKEQDVLNKLIRQGTLAALGVNVKFLNTKFFSGFCQDSKDPKSVVTVHANCCRTITAKMADLTAVIHDWQRFNSFSGDLNRTASFRWSQHVNCVDSWKTR